MENSLENSFENGKYSNQSILNMDIENFIKYHLPLHNISKDSDLQITEYKKLKPFNNITYNTIRKDPLIKFI